MLLSSSHVCIHEQQAPPGCGANRHGMPGVSWWMMHTAPIYQNRFAGSTTHPRPVHQLQRKLQFRSALKHSPAEAHGKRGLSFHFVRGCRSKSTNLARRCTLEEAILRKPLSYSRERLAGIATSTQPTQSQLNWGVSYPAKILRNHL